MKVSARNRFSGNVKHRVNATSPDRQRRVGYHIVARRHLLNGAGALLQR